MKRNVLKGFRCQLGDNFLTVYPNIQLSVKDTEDQETHAPIVALAKVATRAAVRLAGSWRDEGKPHAAFRPIGKK